MTFEWRILWSASSNISFKGKSDWQEWDGFEETIEEVEKAISDGDTSGMSVAEEQFWNLSGCEYYAEVREVQS